MNTSKKHPIFSRYLLLGFTGGILCFLILATIISLQCQREMVCVILLILALVFSFCVVRWIILWVAPYFLHTQFTQYAQDQALDIYTQIEARSYAPQKPFKHAVLLLHGFSASPQEFDFLLPMLKSLALPFYVPNMLGFGLIHLNTLQHVRYQDWLRNALFAFDSLHLFAEQVSIIGHSMGALLATFVAQRRPVHHLILTGPDFYPIQKELIYEKIFLNPLLSKFFCWWIPFVPKPQRNGKTTGLLDPVAAKKSFRFSVIPSNCVAELFKLQKQMNIPDAHYDTLTILHGQHDQSVDVARFLIFLKTHHIQFQEYELKKSAHNVFEDYEKDRACEIVKNILQN